MLILDLTKHLFIFKFRNKTIVVDLCSTETNTFELTGLLLLETFPICIILYVLCDVVRESTRESNDSPKTIVNISRNSGAKLPHTS